MTLAHIMWGVGGFTVGMIVTMLIFDEPPKLNDIDELLKKKKG